MKTLEILEPIDGLDSISQAFLEEHGRQYEPALLPDDIIRGETGKCFDWCALQASRLNPKYQYVEGIALDPELAKQDKERWILHAWLTDGEHVFDPTWQALDDDGTEHPVPSIYIGIPMSIHAVATFMRMTGYQGVLGNRWRLPSIVEDMMKEVAV